MDSSNSKMYSEHWIQDFLYQMHLKFKYCAVNIYLYDWESDFIAITQSGIVHEYEIKLSKLDYYSDLRNKKNKHTILQNGWRWPGVRERQVQNLQLFVRDEAGHIICSRPNYFWYVCPEGIISEVPEYAGLMTTNGQYFSSNSAIKKQAPKLHKDKLEEKKERQLLISIYYRYWKMRLTEYKLNRRKSQ